MTDQADDKTHRLEHASPDILMRMLHQAQKQLEAHQRAACNTRQGKDKRTRAAILADQCASRIRQIQAEAQRRIELELTRQKQAEEDEFLAIATRPYQHDQELTEHEKGKLFQELMKLEDDLTRAKCAEVQFQLQARKAKTETDRFRNAELATYWKKRSENAESRINEWLVMHKDEPYKPWLEDDQDVPGILH